MFTRQILTCKEPKHSEKILWAAYFYMRHVSGETKHNT